MSAMYWLVLNSLLADKVRPRDKHKLGMHHQIGVRVEGWKCVGPVSVDRVGVYFRQALPEPDGAVSTTF
jgi:vacuolar protein sorting-associated protein 13D